MDEREKVISELYERYAPMIGNHIYSDLFQGWDVVGKVFEIFLAEIDRLNISKPNAIKDYFKLRVKNLKRDAIRRLNKEHKADIKIIGDSSIIDFYDKVQYVMKQGYNEEEAKKRVRFNESLLRHRFVIKANSNIPLDSSEDDREYYDKKPLDEDEKRQEDNIVGHIQAHQFVEAQAKCFRKYRKDNSNRDYQALFDYHFKGLGPADLGRKYNRTRERMHQIKKIGMKFIRNCIRCELKMMGCEVS